MPNRCAASATACAWGEAAAVRWMGDVCATDDAGITPAKTRPERRRTGSRQATRFAPTAGWRRETRIGQSRSLRLVGRFQ